MDTDLTLASLRAVRAYQPDPVPAEVLALILDAGRVTGSSRNAQPWSFILVAGEAVEAVAGCVWEPANLAGAAAVVAVAVAGKGPVTFDAGRAAQSMMLAAWDLGVGSCPNGVRDAQRLAEVLALREGEEVAIVLSLGYPEHLHAPDHHSAEEWSQMAGRKALDELIRVVYEPGHPLD